MSAVIGLEKKIVIAGAGILGLWHALLLSRAGHSVHVVERTGVPFSETASQYAGAMISPFCEAESAGPIIRDLGFAAADIWRQTYSKIVFNGTLVVANPRDRSELRRFARMTSGHETIGDQRLAELEPALAERFQTALYYAEEAHMATPTTLNDLMALARQSGATFEFGQDAYTRTAAQNNDEIIIDCCGLAARKHLSNLRGVRGERILVRSRDFQLQRSVRLLHPRHPFYAVPWGDDRILIGATVIESEDTSPMTVRSGLELLGMAYALHPAFAEAEILEMSAGVRPAFPDNIPRVIAKEDGRKFFANGAYRHGFLLAPILASVTRDFISGVIDEHPLLTVE